MFIELIFLCLWSESDTMYIIYTIMYVHHEIFANTVVDKTL